MNRLWHFFLGYILIEISGDGYEQILNRATANNIYLWNLNYSKGKIYGCISVKNFYKISKIRHGLNCKIKIIKKVGLIFKLKKYKKRYGFIIGSIVYIMILLYLSNYIWIINVEGNNSIATQEILNSCKEIGIYEGIKKTKINNKYDSQRLQLIEKRIAWCSLNTEGCVLTVNLSEVTNSDKKDREIPSNLKAKIEGKIKKINVRSGNSLVKVGDTVSRGDILVSGIIENMSSTQFVYSSGEIIAETKRTFSAQEDYIQNISFENGEIITRYTLNFLNFKIPLFLGKVNNDFNCFCSVKNLCLFNKKLPIKIAKEQYKILEKTTMTYDEKELEQKLENNIKNQIEDFNLIKYKSIDKEINYTKTGMLLKITYICEENIAEQNKILLSKEN